MSHEVELMVAHVENLRRQHERNVAELEEAKKTIQQQISRRNSIDQRASPGSLILSCGVCRVCRVLPSCAMFD